MTKKYNDLFELSVELLEALIVAEGTVSFMALATDADPEDYERKHIVDEAIRKGKEALSE